MRQNPDNAPEKKEEYKIKIASMTDETLFKECKGKIWFSAYADNNPHSCFHWQCDYCYTESKNRNKADEIYSKAHKEVSEQ